MERKTGKEEISMIMNWEEEKLKAYIAERPFCDEVEKVFIEVAPDEMIEAYMAQHIISGVAQVALIKCGKHKIVMAMINDPKNNLCPDAEVALIKYGNKEELIAYIKRHPLQLVAQVALLKRPASVGILDLIEEQKFFTKKVSPVL